VAALLLLAVAVGLSNFAGAIGIGVSGVTGRLRLRIAVLFGLFEAGMPVLGLVLGHGAASGLGRSAPWLGGALLIAVGLVSLVVAWRGARGARGAQGSGAGGPAGSGSGVPAGSGSGVPAGSGASGVGVPAGSGSWGTWRVLVSAVALSIDNLAAGFALGPEISGHEPGEALFAGDDGLEVIRRLVDQARDLPLLALEVGFDQARAVTELLRGVSFASVEVVRDLAGHDRVVVARK